MAEHGCENILAQPGNIASEKVAKETRTTVFGLQSQGKRLPPWWHRVRLLLRLLLGHSSKARGLHTSGRGHGLWCWRLWQRLWMGCLAHWHSCSLPTTAVHNYNARTASVEALWRLCLGLPHRTTHIPTHSRMSYSPPLAKTGCPQAADTHSASMNWTCCRMFWPDETR